MKLFRVILAFLAAAATVELIGVAIAVIASIAVGLPFVGSQEGAVAVVAILVLISLSIAYGLVIGAPLVLLATATFGVGVYVWLGRGRVARRAYVIGGGIVGLCVALPICLTAVGVALDQAPLFVILSLGGTAVGALLLAPIGGYVFWSVLRPDLAQPSVP